MSYSLSLIKYSALFLLFIPTSAISQIIPDNSLPNNSQIEVQDNLSLIEGGTEAENNLFHSFQEFSIPTKFEAFFNNAANIENIFSRVTGKNISNIDGLIRANGSANLFFLNPNGIIFGENASLDIGGSFIATTANSINFADGTSFAVPTNNPNITLTIEVPIGLGFGSNTGNIVVQGTGNNLSIPIPEFNIVRDNRPEGIEVRSGQTLALIGGDVTLEGGNLTAPEGRIELGSVGVGETVSLTSADSGWQFNYEGVNQFQDINLLNEASLDTSGDSSGAIQLRGREINVLDGSAVLSNTLGKEGIGEGISIKSDVLNLSGVTSDLFVSVIASDNIDGTGGNLNIDTNQLYMADGSQIRAIVFGSGTTGELNINANDIEITGVNPLNFDYLTSIETSSGIGSRGNINNLNINTRNLQVFNGGRILTNAFGSGNAGNLNINANQTILSGVSSNPINRFTGLSSSGNEGDGGDITINTKNLEIIDGATIRGGTFGRGNGGDININAKDIDLNGIDPRNNSQISLGGIFNSVRRNPTGNGDGGDINIETETLRIVDGARITAESFGSGNAGDINITANNIELSGINPLFPQARSRISTATGNIGNGGNITINADNLTFADIAIVATNTTGNGNAGSVNVNANAVKLSDGSQIRAFTAGRGNAGNININAKDIEVVGINPLEKFRASNIVTASTSPGDGGDTIIKTDNLKLADGARITAEAFGRGDAGSITITAKDIELTGANLFFPNALSGIATSVTYGSGAGSDITIATGSLNIAGGSQIRANTIGNNAGDAGNINITAQDINISGFNPSNPRNVPTTDSSISSNILVSSDSPSKAGEINITTQNLNLTNQGRIEAAAFSSGDAGKINITAEKLENNNGLITATSELTGGGQININTNQLTLDNQGEISTSVFEGVGNGGNITIDTDTLAASNNSQVTANAVRGNGGDITVNTDGYFVSNDFKISATSEFGLDGKVEINISEDDFGKVFVPTPYPIISLQEALAKSCLTQTGRDDNVTRINVFGRGNLPLNPYHSIDEGEGVATTPDSIPSSESTTKAYVYSKKDWQPGEPLIRFEKILSMPNGEALGVAEAEIKKSCLL